MIRFALFLARRLAQDKYIKKSGRRQSPLLRLSLIAVGLSLALMLISTAIIVGFKQKVSDFAYSQTGHISLYSWGNTWLNNRAYIDLSPEFIKAIEERPHTKAVYPLVTEMGMLKTKDDFIGLQLYGVEADFDYPYFANNITEGYLPHFSEADSIRKPIVLPSQITKAMKCKLGDNLKFYFMGRGVQLRTYTLVGTYESAGLKEMPALCPIASLRRLNKLDSNRYSRLMLMINDADDARKEADGIIQSFEEHSELIGNSEIAISTGRELLPDLFNWLELLDSNVYLILVLMLLIGAFSMITGLIIIVLDKRQQIGVLKALGIKNMQLRLAFTFLASKLMLRGVLWANVLAGAFCLLQGYFKVISLDPKNYYMDAVPVGFKLHYWLALNLGTIALIMLLMLGATTIIAGIKPAEIIREE